MNAIWDRVKPGKEGPGVGRSSLSVGEVVDALEGNGSWSEVATKLDLEPIDLIAACAADALGDDGALGPELTQTPPARPKLRSVLSESGLRSLVPAATRPDRLVLASGLLQIADFWDPSHEAAQTAEDLGEREFSAYWHGIAHRREPDPGNASYWFRRVGNHALFGPLAEAAQRIDDTNPRFGRGNRWDAMDFITFCTRTRAGTPDAELARRIQRLEMLMLLDATWQRVSVGLT